MELVARRKNAFKDKSLTIALWRTWTVCVVLCGAISMLLWGHFSFGPMATTKVTVNFHQLSKLPAITYEDLKIPLSDPMGSIYVKDAVLFPDCVMLLVKVSRSLRLVGDIDGLECRFGGENGTITPVISVKPRTKDLQMVRCGHPTATEVSTQIYSNVTLGIRESDVRVQSSALYSKNRLPDWSALVYESLVASDSLVLLAKGLVTRASKRISESTVKCVFGTNLPTEIIFETRVLTAAQEVIRCEKPPVHLEEMLRGCRLSVKTTWQLGVLPSVTYYDPDKGPESFLASFLKRDLSKASTEDRAEDTENVQDRHLVLPGDSKISTSRSTNEPSTLDGGVPVKPVLKRKLCACTMVWNKAQFIREWVLFHSFMGVEKYFVYDNDSDDDTEEVLDSLAAYNISRMVWPWIKTQQAAFSHCTIIAREECEWMMFSDVDEYIYPFYYLRKAESDSPSDAMVLHRLIEGERNKVDKSVGSLGEIQFDCNNFGPSGLEHTPLQGVTVGYTCRLKNPERHKSIVLLEAVNSSLMNVLHHFELQEGYQSTKLLRRAAVVNHYKFQAWDAFKMKFVRRAGTYTTDWKSSENTSSKDRTPGLGTEAVKPDDWESRFCEVHDTGLRDFSLRTFGLPGQPDKLEWQVHR